MGGAGRATAPGAWGIGLPHGCLVSAEQAARTGAWAFGPAFEGMTGRTRCRTPCPNPALSATQGSSDETIPRPAWQVVAAATPTGGGLLPRVKSGDRCAPRKKQGLPLPLRAWAAKRPRLGGGVARHGPSTPPPNRPSPPQGEGESLLHPPQFHPGRVGRRPVANSQ